ncbi:MAG TPA: hypothetical protein VFJ93_00795 [Gaiellaceae bacterium]|nr:hypothetical protein [Gaiellaceae bacterium]
MSDQLIIPPFRRVEPSERERLRGHLVSEYRRTLGRPGRQTRRRSLIVVVAVLVAAVLGAAAYAGFVLTRPSHELSVGCYERASLGANTAVFATNGRAPAAVCASEWSRAFPQTTKPAAFATCVLPTSAYGVFPATRGDTCAKLGLGVASPAKRARSEALDFARLQRALVNALLGKCLDERAARMTTRRLLDEHGYGDWRIAAPQPFSSTRRCASPAFDEPQRTLILVPVPRK